MTPERMAGLVARWVRIYTRDLPTPVAERRIAELDADLHDHITQERSDGTADRRIALSIAARMLRGLPADASWRSRTIARTSTSKEAKMRKPISRSVVRVALATGLILGLTVVAGLIAGDWNWGLGDFVLATALLAGTGTLLELAVRKPRSIAFRAAAAAVGVAAIVFGEADDAPGLVLFGGLLIVGTVALAFRTAQRSQ